MAPGAPGALIASGQGLEKQAEQHRFSVTCSAAQSAVQQAVPGTLRQLSGNRLQVCSLPALQHTLPACGWPTPVPSLAACCEQSPEHVTKQKCTEAEQIAVQLKLGER